MNIIYKLTNLTTSENLKYYIGSKTNCDIREENGITIIFDKESGQDYLSSSRSLIFRNDLQVGHQFTAEVLEIVQDVSTLIDIETKYLIENDCANNPEYYNLSNQALKHTSLHKLYNGFDESIKDYGQAQANMSKRDNTAKSLGYDNYGDLAFFIYDEKLKPSRTFSDIAKILNKDRHFPQTFISKWEMDKALKELELLLDEEFKTIFRLFISKNKVSLKKACEIFNIEEPVGRLLLGDYYFNSNNNFKIAKRLGLTHEEFCLKIVKLIKEGKSFIDCAKELSITTAVVQRAVEYYIRETITFDESN